MVRSCELEKQVHELKGECPTASKQYLQFEKEKYRSIVEDQTEFICRHLSNGIITFANNSYCRYFGKTQKEIIGYNLFNLRRSAKAQKEIYRIFSLLNQENPVITNEIYVTTPRGEQHWEQWVNRVIYDDRGDIVEYQAVGRDITPLKKFEEDLRKSEQLYRTLVENQIELISRHLPDNTLTFVNQAYCLYFGKSRDELIGSNFLDLLPEKEQIVVQRVQDGITLESPVKSCERKSIMPNGEICWQYWNMYGIFDPSGNLVEIQSEGMDITRLKKTEEALEHKNIALHEIFLQVNREKQQIIDNITVNINELLLPLVRKAILPGKYFNRNYLKVLEGTLITLNSSFGQKITSLNKKLTPREVEICNLIKNGLTSKEIAEFLKISLKTVNIHRNHIRKKLMILHKKINLSVFLQDY